LETPSLDRKKLLYECKVSWNKIMKGIKILVLKGFGVVHGRGMVWHTNYT
jgi:hypothetical protein